MLGICGAKQNDITEIRILFSRDLGRSMQYFKEARELTHPRGLNGVIVASVSVSALRGMCPNTST